MIKITGLFVPLNFNFDDLNDFVAKKLSIEPDSIHRVTLFKRSIDISNKQDIRFEITVLVHIIHNERSVLLHNKCKTISKEIEVKYNVPQKKLLTRPVVVGCGPAGLFAALILAQAGARPILLERGQDVYTRKETINTFWKTGLLTTTSNVQFGEGGAGAFSDGKLKVGKKDPRKMMILNELIEAGAPPEILYLAKPHIGTDRLITVVKNLREKIISFGGEVHFGATVTDIVRYNQKVIGVQFNQHDTSSTIETDSVVLAIGHSARDTFETLHRTGVQIEQKPFAIGVRIEHPQMLLNKIQYGDFSEHPALGAADYRMVVHLPDGRNVYTFCMCPGGIVVAATSENNCLVTNGMSNYARDGRNANSALLVTIDKNDLQSNHPLAGIEYQRKIEESAFRAGGCTYNAPVQRFEDFMCKRTSTKFGDVTPTYEPGTTLTSLDSFLPNYVVDSLRSGLAEMGEWMPGYAYPDAILTGVESRSSSPVRIIRNENCEAINIQGLFPCGEGAGYAGGIISAAIDGVICAEKILG